MSTLQSQQHAADETWFQRITDALQAVEALYQTVSRENGNTAILARQVRSLKAARLAWLTGSRERAHRLVAAALNQGDDSRLPAATPAADLPVQHAEIAAL